MWAHSYSVIRAFKIGRKALSQCRIHNFFKRFAELSGSTLEDPGQIIVEGQRSSHMLHHRILEADQDINAGVMSERWVTGRRGVSTKTEIRNSNLEVLNKHELIKHEIKPRAQFGTFWNFGFIFGFRYSIFGITNPLAVFASQ